MSDITIHVEGLSKAYQITAGQERKPYRTLQEDLLALPRRLLRGGVRGGGAKETIWALDDLSFDVYEGEVLGVIGRNGAGKSTLLKVLSRITEPTKGQADIYGRVGSLLEVGTGFHPELTGRENVYLSGAVLGMRREEISRKFDDIVAFGEITRFIDTPVKRYSSGMQMRLAFAVAVHLEPEILFIDEVLAVGDAQFQKKCYEKMQEIGREGRSILFVSHNMSALRSICSRGIVLERGAIVDDGPIDVVADAYLARTNQAVSTRRTVETPSFSVKKVQIEAISSAVIKTFEPVRIIVTFTPKIDIGDPGIYVGFLTMDSHRVAGLDFRDFCESPPVRAGRTAELGFTIDSFPLLPGTYQLEIHMKDMSSQCIEFVPENFEFEVVETPVYGGRKLDSWFGQVGLRANGHARIAGSADDRAESFSER
jgi:lipopolysaccharide transport system ATP-binding protein